MKFNRIVLVSIILLILAVGAVSAADENITSATDEVLSAEASDEVISAESAEELEVTQPEDFSELVGLIKNTSSGKTLTLEKDYINEGTYTKGILISKKMTIDGQGHTLDANQKSNIFRVSNSQVILKNINFINSYTEDYSAVYGNCTVINCTFTDCTSKNDGGALYNGTAYDSSFIRCEAYIEDSNKILKDYNKGGAIYQGDAHNCYFEDCHAISEYGYDVIDEWIADGYGGAIYKGNAYDCSFIKCSSVYGGAIYNGNAYNSNFENCSDFRLAFYEGFGGAINQGDAYNCSFKNCYAYSGGAVYQGNAYNSSFIHCYAYEGMISSSKGGAISSGNVYNCYFEDCYADEGGAISSGNATNCSFVECYADGRYSEGGIIYKGNAYDSLFINCTSKKGIIVDGNYINCTFIPMTLSCPNMTVTYGEGEKLPVRLIDINGDDIDGVTVDVKIYKNNKIIKSLSTASGTDLLIDAAPGTYIIALTCEYANPQNITLIINKVSPKMVFATDFAKSGETANVKVTISKKATGNVKIIINGETYRVPINSGVAIAEVPGLADGIYTVKATYAGNAYHVAETVTGSFQVGKANQGMKLATKNINVGQTERLTATLAKDATGFVRFIIGDDTYKVAIENGAAYADITDLKAGSYSVILKYGGNYRYNAESVSKTFTVSKSSPAIIITADSIIAGETATIRVNLVGDAPGNVMITVNGESQKVKIENGVATLTLKNLKAGTYDVGVKYNGNYKYNAETKTASFNVSKISPELKVFKTTVDGKTVLTANIGADATGNVNFNVNGNTYKAKIVSGVATLTLPDMAPGTYTLKSSYGGNYKYLPETKTRTITIK